MTLSRLDEDFLELARFWADRRSKDPSTKVGAALVSPDNYVVILGYNGFPRGIKDDWRLDCRETKYPRVVHAEINAILNCPQRPVGWTLYCTLFPCSDWGCAAQIVQAGIARVVAPMPEHGRWGDSQLIARDIFVEAGLELVFP